MKQDRLLEFMLKPDYQREFYENYCKYSMRLIQSIDFSAIADVSECFLHARQRGSTIFFAGNGGSAATASHFSQDLANIGRKVTVRGFKTISLTNNVPFITAAGNDFGYNNVFVNQMLEIFNPGDVLVAISASGNSQNVIEAVRYAHDQDGTTVGFVGFDGGTLSELCDHVIHVVSKKGEYGSVEDIHMIMNHMITSFLKSELQNGRNVK